VNNQDSGAPPTHPVKTPPTHPPSTRTTATGYHTHHDAIATGYRSGHAYIVGRGLC
jgi:hypothetical protein